jgi:hypothetical protein
VLKPRNESIAMKKLYDVGVQQGLSPDDATSAAAMLRERYGSHFVSLLSDDDVSQQTLAEAAELAREAAGIPVPQSNEEQTQHE